MGKKKATVGERIAERWEPGRDWSIRQRGDIASRIDAAVRKEQVATLKRCCAVWNGNHGKKGHVCGWPEFAKKDGGPR